MLAPGRPVAPSVPHTQASATHIHASMSALHASSSSISPVGTPAPGSSHGSVSASAAALARSASQPVAAPALPLSPAQVLKFYAAALAPYEQGEILEYKRVYFLGTGGANTPAIPVTSKAAATANSRAPNNHGFDDAKGVYARLVPGDHIAYRYEIISLLGEGSFGQVVAAFDHADHAMVAVKLVRNKKRFRNQAMIELALLTTLRDAELRERQDAVETNTSSRPGARAGMAVGSADASDRVHDGGRSGDATAGSSIDHHIIHVKDSFVFRSHVAFTFPMLSINLYELIKKNHFRGLSLNLIRRFAVQILDGLCFLSSLNVVHCDLKPENILLRSPSKSAIDIIDLGSSCYENERIYTYIQSRFYRAPEVILQLPYGKPIDIWSFGCILAELLTGYPLFAGEDETDQLASQMEILGAPPAAIIESSPRRGKFFDEDTLSPIPFTNSRGKRREPGTKALVSVLKLSPGSPSLPGTSAASPANTDAQNFLSFLAACLRWDPATRITPFEAMRHPWIAPAVPAPRHIAPVRTPVPSHTSTGSTRLTVELPSEPARARAHIDSVESVAKSHAPQGHATARPTVVTLDELRAHPGAASTVTVEKHDPLSTSLEPRRPAGGAAPAFAHRPARNFVAQGEAGHLPAATADTGGTDASLARSSDAVAADTGGDVGGAPVFPSVAVETSKHAAAQASPPGDPANPIGGAANPAARGRGPHVHALPSPTHADRANAGVHRETTDAISHAAKVSSVRGPAAAIPDSSERSPAASGVVAAPRRPEIRAAARPGAAGTSPRMRGSGYNAGVGARSDSLPIVGGVMSAVVREARVEAAVTDGTHAGSPGTGELQAWLRAQRRQADAAESAPSAPVSGLVYGRVDAATSGGKELDWPTPAGRPAESSVGKIQAKLYADGSQIASALPLESALSAAATSLLSTARQAHGLEHTEARTATITHQHHRSTSLATSRQRQRPVHGLAAISPGGPPRAVRHLPHEPTDTSGVDTIGLLGRIRAGHPAGTRVAPMEIMGSPATPAAPERPLRAEGSPLVPVSMTPAGLPSSLPLASAALVGGATSVRTSGTRHGHRGWYHARGTSMPPAVHQDAPSVPLVAERAGASEDIRLPERVPDRAAAIRTAAPSQAAASNASVSGWRRGLTFGLRGTRGDARSKAAETSA